MALLVQPGPVPAAELLAALNDQAPGMPVRLWPEVGAPGDIEFALVSRIPAGVLPRLPRLRLVGSLHAGVDQLLHAGGVPSQVPLTRPVPKDGDALMNEYILAQVLSLHRHLPTYAQAQRDRRWHKLPARPLAGLRVGFLGHGAMAAPAARLLGSLGVDVAAWARRPREEAGGVPVFHGQEGLATLLARSQILVNLLPLTAATGNILDAALFARMPRGACLVNVGRGEHLVESDLLAALDRGQLAHAVLDVFREEPLPADSPLWAHAGITITPHACRTVDVRAVVADFLEEVDRVRQGLQPLRVVDREAGY